MSGIIFFKTKSLQLMHEFYHDKLKMSFWLKQKNCHIYQSGNFLIGFLESDIAETEGIITFFDQDKDIIDKRYTAMQDIIFKELKTNEDYNIYHFYVKDPEGRAVEFQTFLHQLKPYKSLYEGLAERRSIRKFKNIEISANILNEVFSVCRYSPTSRNSQSFYYLVIKNKEDLKWLADIRGDASKQIANAPLTVLVVADQTKTLRAEQDANIAATYFMLSAYTHDLGTCWITDMNKVEIKERFNIPVNDYISCAIPTGYPDEKKDIPNRRNINDFVRYL